MSNVIIASVNPASQTVKNWFVTKKGYVTGPLDSLKDNEQLIIVAHDSELGDASLFLTNLLKQDFPMVPFKILLIVCSASSYKFSSNLVTPAQNIANHFKRNVEAAGSTVTATLTDYSAVISGNFVTVQPGTDVTSMMGALKV